MIHDNLTNRYFEILEQRNTEGKFGLLFVFECDQKYYYVNCSNLRWADPVEIDFIPEKKINA